MAETTATQRLNELKAAATDWFARQRRYLNAEWEFLDAIQSKRGGSMTLQDGNADGASKILVNSINEYLGQPVEPPNVPSGTG